MVRPARSQPPRFAPRLVAVALLVVSASGGGAADDPTAALEDIYREHDIQRQLSIDLPRGEGPPVRHWAIPSAFGWVVLGIATIGAVALALWLVAFDLGPNTARRRRRRARQDSAGVATDSKPPAPADWLRVADDLERQGHFGEAIHTLLLGVLGTLRTSNGQASGAKTAREIARSHLGAHRERLQALVGTSELVHFGGRAATREQFEDCRRDAVEFAAAAGPATA